MAPAKRRPWYKRLADLDIAQLFSNKRKPSADPRTVYVNQPLPDDSLDHKGRLHPKHVFATSQVLTSKYTVFTFLPRNLLEQFRRVANMCVFPPRQPARSRLSTPSPPVSF